MQAARGMLAGTLAVSLGRDGPIGPHAVETSELARCSFPFGGRFGSVITSKNDRPAPASLRDVSPNRPITEVEFSPNSSVRFVGRLSRQRPPTFRSQKESIQLMATITRSKAVVELDAATVRFCGDSGDG